MKIEFERQVQQLADLIDEINKPLSNLDRKKLITLCTIDVHARDVVGRLIEERVEDGMCFQWQSQLRYYQVISQMRRMSGDAVGLVKAEVWLDSGKAGIICWSTQLECQPAARRLPPCVL